MRCDGISKIINLKLEIATKRHTAQSCVRGRHPCLVAICVLRWDETVSIIKWILDPLKVFNNLGDLYFKSLKKSG